MSATMFFLYQTVLVSEICMGYPQQYSIYSNFDAYLGDTVARAPFINVDYL